MASAATLTGSEEEGGAEEPRQQAMDDGDGATLGGDGDGATPGGDGDEATLDNDGDGATEKRKQATEQKQQEEEEKKAADRARNKGSMARRQAEHNALKAAEQEKALQGKIAKQLAAEERMGEFGPAPRKSARQEEPRQQAIDDGADVGGDGDTQGGDGDGATPGGDDDGATLGGDDDDAADETEEDQVKGTQPQEKPEDAFD
jgi:hypothetical protein